MFRISLVVLVALIAVYWVVLGGSYPPVPTDPETAPAPVDPLAPVVPEIAVRPINTGLLNFDLVTAPRNAVEGVAGALAVADAGLLVARRLDGVLTYLDRTTGALRALPLQLPPLNLDQMPARFDSGRAVRAEDMRYNDIEIIQVGGAPNLFVSYNYYDAERVCFQLRLDAAVMVANWETSTEAPAPLVWRNFFASEPCLPPSDDRNTFAGIQAGGRMALAPDGSLLLTVGDYEFDGLGRKQPAVSREDGYDYGRVLRIDLATGAATEVSRGHRNPQGIVVDAAGRVWVAEHGAMGGDELNLITEGRDYGWPNVTLGVLYTDPASDTKAWPRNPRQGRHDLLAPPSFAWMPSIAPSSMTIATGVHERWEGDLLVGALIDQSLHRLRLEDDRVVYDERIALGERVRDLAVLGNRIYLLFDSGVLGLLIPHTMSDIDNRQDSVGTLLRDRGCVDCHANPQAPRLAGVFGTDIASQPDITYSAALLELEGTWTRERLAAFLQSPSSFAPGTMMPDPALDAAELETILIELERLKP